YPSSTRLPAPPRPPSAKRGRSRSRLGGRAGGLAADPGGAGGHRAAPRPRLVTTSARVTRRDNPCRANITAGQGDTLSSTLPTPTCLSNNHFSGNSRVASRALNMLPPLNRGTADGELRACQD